MSNFEIFTSFDLIEKQVDILYNIFLKTYKDEYFTKDSFLSRRWSFFGTKPSGSEGEKLAFISYRKQRSGSIKLTGMASNNPLLLRNVAREFSQRFKEIPVWSSPTPNLVEVAKRNMNMYAPSEMPGGVELLKELVPKIPSYVFGGETPEVTDEGNLRVSNPITFEKMDKVLIGNMAYLKSIITNPLLQESPSVEKFIELNPELFSLAESVNANFIINKLIKLANKLDSMGLKKEANIVDDLIKEAAKKKKERTPTKPELWARAKAKAKAKYDVWPSAYSIGFALREYKKMGGGWRGKKPIK